MNKETRTKRRILGDLGEDIACKYLEKKGFSIIERNYLRKWGEIDIITEKENKVHFIEVKSVSREINANFSRETDNYRPEDNLHPWKLLRIGRTIQTYLASHTVSREIDWQFDVITVYIDKNRRISRVFMMENMIL